MRHTLPLFVMTLLAAAPAIAFQTPQPAAAQAPLRVGGQTKAPERIKYVAPVYPEAAAAAKVSGVVIVEATIGKDGSVTEARVLRSIALLDQAALDAVKQWKYTPTTLNGAPVPVIITVTVNFTPPGADAAMAPSARTAISPVSIQTPQAAEAAAPARSVDPNIDRSDANIKLTLTVTDAAAAATAKKTVTLMVANLSSSRVRSTGFAKGGIELNVDASAELRKSGLIRLNLTIGYTPESADETGAKLLGVNESVSIFLKDGVPTVVTQAADPTKGSRSVTVEVTATVVK